MHIWMIDWFRIFYTKKSSEPIEHKSVQDDEFLPSWVISLICLNLHEDMTFVNSGIGQGGDCCMSTYITLLRQ